VFYFLRYLKGDISLEEQIFSRGFENGNRGRVTPLKKRET
jgi:hypothetical protein